MPWQVFSILTGAIIGFIGGIYFSVRFGDAFINAAVVGTIVGSGLAAACCAFERWNPFKTKCDECGSTNLVPWDYDRDTCLDCGAAVPSYETQNAAFRASHPEIFDKKKPLQ